MDWEEGQSTYSMPVESRTSEEILKDIEKVTIELKKICYNPVVKFKVGSELLRHIKEHFQNKDKKDCRGLIPLNGISVYEDTDHLGPWGFKSVYEDDIDNPGYWIKKREELWKEYASITFDNIKLKNPIDYMEILWAGMHLKKSIIKEEP